MNFDFGSRPVGRHLALLAAGAVMVLLAFAARARAAETIFWDNYSGNSLAYANLDGSGGGLLDLGGAELNDPEGTALDVAGGRLFAASSSGGENGQIVFANIDGSGGGTLNTGGAPLDNPEGVAIDPGTGTIYWANSGSNPDLGSIGWARLDGSGGGTLNTAGATVNHPYRVGLDSVHGRIYWSNTGGESELISYANLDGSGGGDLDITGPSEINVAGFAVDPAAGKLYWINNESGDELISYTGLNGGPGGDLASTGVFNGPYGLAFDPTISRFYWGNYSNSGEATNAIGTQDLSGAGGGITIATAADVDGPQDPVVLNSPIAGGAPVVTRSASPTEVSCSAGTWASYPSSFVYAEPRSYAYQWTKDGAAIPGATATTLTATAPGSYACTVTATNQAGSTVQASAPVTVQVSAPVSAEAAKLKLVVKTKKVRAKAGKKATFRVQAVNQGDLGAKARLCLKLPKKAKKALKAGKCASLGTLAADGQKLAKLTVKVGKEATGIYKLKIVAKGVPAKAAKVKLQVVG